MNHLADILTLKRQEIAALRASAGGERLRGEAEKQSAVRGFARSLRSSRHAIIAEIKKASPSRGILTDDFHPSEIAKEYASGGAAAISVLTDGPFFQGSAEHLREARLATALPVLRKDFVLDVLQVYESRAIGADALLLIVRLLDQSSLERLLRVTADLGMDALVEVHDHEELSRANAAGAEIIGVNNRDLDTFDVSLETSLRLRDSIRTGALAVSESGVKGAAEAARLWNAGYDALLVGEGVIGASNRATAVRALTEGPYAGPVR